MDAGWIGREVIEGNMCEVFYVLRDSFARRNHWVLSVEDRQSTQHETFLAEVKEGDGEDALTGLARRKAKAIGMMDGGNSIKVLLPRRLAQQRSWHC